MCCSQDNIFLQYKKSVKFDLKKAYSLLGASDGGRADFSYLIESASVFSSNIEGNSMDLNSFMNSKQLKRKPREFKEIADLAKGYVFVKKRALNEKNFLQAHSIIFQNFLIKPNRGQYRCDKIGVFSNHGLVYMAVEPEFVSREMQTLFCEIKNSLKQDLDIYEVFYFASQLHLRIAQIHPFFDGNGRMARLIEKWFLSLKLDDNAWLIQSEMFYNNNRQDYYNNINLGPNYYELRQERALSFLLMLPRAIYSF